MKLTDATGRCPFGQKDRGRAQVVVSTLGNSPYRCQGQEPVSARSGSPMSQALRERSP
jgi:hypothetical protein